MRGVTVSKTVRSGRPALRVTWTTPYSEVSISQYQVQYRRRGYSARTVYVHSTVTSTALEALFAGTVYQVQVRAVSTVGTGVWSVVESKSTHQREFSVKAMVLYSNFY